MPQITPQELKRICKELKLYSTPELNDKLYLHYKGYTRIENLDPYTGLKVIYLEGNGFTKIEGLDKLTEIRCLYLQENCITRIENIENLVLLDTLNLSQNHISRIEGLGTLTKLNSLIVTNNKIKSVEDVKGLLDCLTLSVVDIKDNKLDDVNIIDVFEQMPNLKVLYLKGNPVVEKIKNYRKTLISRLPKLTYLDDRPVFEEDRVLAEAWARGGPEAEKKQREQIRLQKEERDNRNFQAFQDMIAAARLRKAANEGTSASIEEIDDDSEEKAEVQDVKEELVRNSESQKPEEVDGLVPALEDLPLDDAKRVFTDKHEETLKVASVSESVSLLAPSATSGYKTRPTNVIYASSNDAPVKTIDTLQTAPKGLIEEISSEELDVNAID